ncbi:hypothetical protein N0V93_008503 [Gnomoniopsis smithogilvyi]|uniref:Uncharacterized protein n=1 Tax=Gnomoniopsis smithogilvyi TaxID=1191159 RepID=A0A9W9CTR7_9PEZI|nr:hypothetical protein N0V93_008503 [Gnomoniopsis smithogilvyi]
MKEPPIDSPTTAQSNRWTRLDPFFDFYKASTASYVSNLLQVNDDPPALTKHEDLLDIIRLLKENPSRPRGDLVKECFSPDPRAPEDYRKPAESDIHRAFNLATRIITMVNCAGENQPADLLDDGSEPLEWRNSDSLQQFLASAFPLRDHPTLNEKGQRDEIGLKSQLKATNLRDVAGLTFRGTDNLKDHLRLTQDTGVVELYHHTSILKEHLGLGSPNEHPTTSMMCANNAIPRLLALETLDSLQKILFPVDQKSRRMLRSLVSKEQLDPDCLRFEAVISRTDEENDIKYQYWASRLMDLYDEVENPKARGFLEQWMERKSGARYVMMATLAGVVVAVVLGFLGLVVGIFQAWVGYQQWRHPIPSA